MKLTEAQLAKMKEYRQKRDHLGLIMANALLAFEQAKQQCLQRIQINQHEQQEYIEAIAREGGIDTSKPYQVNYETGEIEVM